MKLPDLHLDVKDVAVGVGGVHIEDDELLVDVFRAHLRVEDGEAANRGDVGLRQKAVERVAQQVGVLPKEQLEDQIILRREQLHCLASLIEVTLTWFVS